MPDNSEDSVTLTMLRPQQNWFNKAATMQSSIADAMGAIESEAKSYTLASLAAAEAPMPAISAQAPTAGSTQVSPEIAGIEQSINALKDMAEQELPPEVDYELAVGALLDEVSTTMDELLEGKLKANEQVVSLILDSFQNIAKLLSNVPQYLAEEVGELGADICNVIELKGGNPNPIIAFFNS
jgi:hypothetical protein